MLASLPLSGLPVAAEAPSAGGAALDQIIVVALAAAVVYGAVGWIVLRERTGHATLVGRLASAVGRLDGSPRWFLLPTGVVTAGLVSAVTGLYWDVSYHLAEGRDEGPLANPAHYLIFLGLVAVFAGAILGVGLADDRLPRNTFRVTRRWRSPYSPLVAMAVGLIALSGFPLDDLWHRLFGQDVTEWGPTHVLMIGGSVLSGYAVLLACAEVRQVARDSVLVDHVERLGLLIIPTGPVAFLLEYAFGIPQFPLVNDALIIAMTGAVTFVLASLRGPLTVVLVWVGYAAIQGLLVGLNTWAFDALTPYPPLLLGGALVGLVLSRWARPTPGYGAVAGVLVALGTVAGDHLWTLAVRPQDWPTALLPTIAAWTVVVGLGTGVVAVWLMDRMTATAGDGAPARPAPVPAAALRRLPAYALLGAVAVTAVLAWNIPPRAEHHPGADLALVDVTGGPGAEQGYVQLTFDAAATTELEQAYWFQALSWQGGGAVRSAMVETAPGVWRSADPLPLHADWKTMVRLHLPAHDLLALPVYLPADAAIPVPAVPAVDGPRDFVEEKLILRREEKPDVPGWLSGSAYAVVGVLFAGLFVAIAAGYRAAARPGEEQPAPARTTETAGAGR